MALFGKKSDHPMADIKAAKELLSDLPKGDSLKALQEIAGWIDSVNHDEVMRLDARYEALKLLEDSARTHENKVTREYFPATPPSKIHENRLWTALNDLFGNLAKGYHDVLSGCLDGAKGASSLKDDQLNLTLRGIHATMGWMKCAAVRYTPPDTAAWSYLADYFLHAEDQGFLNEETELPGGGGAKNTVRLRIAAVLLWWGSGTGSLKPQQIHLSERLIAHLSPDLNFSDEPGEDSQFTFDLDQPSTPIRYNKDAATTAGARFLRLGNVQGPLLSLVNSLEKNMVPSGVNLGGAYEADAVHEAAKRLSNAWTSAPPVRRTIRRTVNVPMNVVRGYAGLIDQVFAGNSDDPAGEDWQAEDISASGFRCILPAGQGSWIKVGSLIGYRPENVKHWGAGIVRRLRRNDQNELDVGVEVLSHQANTVNLHEQGSQDSRMALWLNHSPESGETRVLVTPGAFAENRTLQGNKDNQKILLIPQKLDEKGDDYDLMRFRMVTQEG